MKLGLDKLPRLMQLEFILAVFSGLVDITYKANCISAFVVLFDITIIMLLLHQQNIIDN